jgi:cell division protein FtsL
MDFSDTAKAQVLSVEQSQQDDRQKVLESAVSTVAALRRLLAEYERLETERNDFERERARMLLENNTLRKQAKEAKDQRELLVRALETLTTRMDAIGVSCIEAAKTTRTQSFDSPPLVPANEPPRNEEQSSEPTTSSADVPAQMPNVLDPARWPAAPSTANTERAPAMNFQVRSQYMSQ